MASKNRVIEWGLDEDTTYLMAGDLDEPDAMKNFLGRMAEYAPAGLSAFQAAVCWFETHHPVRETQPQIQVSEDAE